MENMRKKLWIWFVPMLLVVVVAVLWFTGIIPKQIARIVGTNYVKEHFPKMEMAYKGIECADVYGDYLISFEDKDGNEYSCVIGPKLFPTTLGQGLFAIEDYYAENYSVSDVGGVDDPDTVEIEESGRNELFDITTEPGISDDIEIKTEKEKYSSDDKVIKYSIKNTSNFERSIAGDDECFSLQMLDVGEWKRVGTKVDHNWNSLGQVLDPMRTEYREIDLEKYFNLPLEKGIYRVVVEGIASNIFEVE